MTNDEFERRFTPFQDALRKLSVDDVRAVAHVFGDEYHSADPIFDPDGKQKYFDDIRDYLRTARASNERLAELRRAFSVLKREL